MIKRNEICLMIICSLVLTTEVSAGNNQTHIHFQNTNETIKKIQLSANLTKIQDLSTDPHIFHAEINEFDAKLNLVASADQSCKITGSSLNLTPLSNLTLPSSIISPPYYKEDQLFLITDKPQLLCIELTDKEARIAGQLDLPKTETDTANAIISNGEDFKSLAILTADLKVLTVNITSLEKLSLSAEQSIHLPKQEDHIYDFLSYKKHIILAIGQSGLRIFNAENKTAPKLMKTLGGIDFKTLSEINITQVWEKNGVLFIADTLNGKYKTYMFNVSDINQGAEIRRLRGEDTLNGVHLEKSSFSSRPGFYFGFGNNVTIEFQDETKYSQHNPWLKMKPSRVHELGDGSNIRVFGGSNQTMVVLTENEIHFINMKSAAPQSTLPYNLLAHKKAIKGFEGTHFLILSNRNSSILGFGSRNTIHVYTVEEEKAQVQCSSLPQGSFRAAILQLLSTNCADANSTQDFCVSTHKFLIGSNPSSFPQAYEFPNVSVPTLQEIHPFISSMIRSKNNQPDWFEEDIEAESHRVEPEGNIASLLIFTVVIVSLFLIVLLLVIKNKRKPVIKLGKAETIEIQTRDKQGTLQYGAVDADEEDSEQAV